jgi:hypothetical protein
MFYYLMPVKGRGARRGKSEAKHGEHGGRAENAEKETTRKEGFFVVRQGGLLRMTAECERYWGGRRFNFSGQLSMMWI